MNLLLVWFGKGGRGAYAYAGDIRIRSVVAIAADGDGTVELYPGGCHVEGGMRLRVCREGKCFLNFEEVVRIGMSFDKSSEGMASGEFGGLGRNRGWCGREKEHEA